MNLAMDLIREALLGGSGGGGGGSNSFTLIDSREIEISTSSTSATVIREDAISSLDLIDPDSYFYIKIRDKAGHRNGYFYGSDAFYYNNTVSAGTDMAALIFVFAQSSATKMTCSPYTASNPYGVWVQIPYSSNQSGQKMQIKARYGSSASKTIDGTFTVELYKVTFNGNSFFA